MDYSEYLTKYVNSLKTGEMLVDLTNHDIYVTEEGLNIPIPTTKKLREQVVNFLENDLEGLKLQTNSAVATLERLHTTIRAAKAQADSIYTTTLDNNIPSAYYSGEETFIKSINQKTVNQLGDLKLNYDALENSTLASELSALVTEFNRVNSNSASGLYSNTASSNNAYLMSLWTDINNLLSTVKTKLDTLGSFSGSVKLKRNTTRTVEAYDCTYSRRLNNFTTWSYVGNLTDYINTTRSSQAKFEAWFRGQAYLDLTRPDMTFGGEQGTGLWYKGFPLKTDLATGSKAARRYEQWDLFEVVPLSDFRSYTPGWNIDYLRSLSNNVIIDLESKGAYASFSDWTTRFIFSKWTTDVSKFGGGSDFWRQPITANGATTMSTTHDLMEIVSNMNDPYRMQRTPKQTYGQGITSKYAPALATMVRAIPYYSSVGIANTDGIIMRLGLRKTLRETALDYASYQYNGSAWVRK